MQPSFTIFTVFKLNLKENVEHTHRSKKKKTAAYTDVKGRTPMSVCICNRCRNQLIWQDIMRHNK